MARRYLVALVLGGTVTFGLFYVMQALISMTGHQESRFRRATIRFVRIPRDEATQRKRRELPKRAGRQHDPIPPPVPLQNDHGATTDPLAIPLPGYGDGLVVRGNPSLGNAASDTDVIPLVRVNPQYPLQAKRKRIEGWVHVAFAIDKKGAVEDPYVIASHPPGVFERSALRAIRKWRYEPKIVAGKAVVRPRVSVRITFELLEDEGDS